MAGQSESSDNLSALENAGHVGQIRHDECLDVESEARSVVVEVHQALDCLRMSVSASVYQKCGSMALSVQQVGRTDQGSTLPLGIRSHAHQDRMAARGSHRLVGPKT